MRVAHAFEGLLGCPALRRIWSELDDLLPGFRRALQILLSEGADDSDVQVGLRVARIRSQRTLKLFERAIRLVHVVVGDSEIGARIGVARIDLQRLFIPFRGILKPFGIEVQIGELNANACIGGVLLGARAQI